MKISDYEMSLRGQSQLIQHEKTQENLVIWTGQNIGDRLEISEQAVAVQLNEYSEELPVSDADKLKIHLIETFIEALTGKRIKIRIPRIKAQTNKAGQNGFSADQTRRGGRSGWGITYDYSRTRYNKESMSFSARGTVKTEDGREISIDVSLKMTREFIEKNEIHIREGDAALVDPLVINYEGNLPQLSATKFSFDLDADGQNEQVSFVSGNSGFLCLDLNNDGIINNGKELFGPATGDGFSELARYDSDNNRWIDENDAVFSKLRIWTKDELGQDYLLALGEVGVGAIYLGSAATLFALHDNQNMPAGNIQKTGIFLHESGRAGTIQHIDLAV